MSLVRAGLLVAAILLLAAITIAQRLALPLSQSLCLAWLATAESQRFALTATKTPPLETPPAVTTIGLAVTASNEDLPLVHRLLTVRLPANDPYVTALLRYTSEAAYEGTTVPLLTAAEPQTGARIQRLLLESLLGSGYGPLDRSHAEALVNSLRELPTIVIDGPVATLTFVLPDSEVFGDALYPDKARLLSWPIGVPWEVGAVDDDLAFRAVGTVVPNRSRWDVDVCLEGLGVEAVSSPPAYSDGAGRLSWTFPPGATFADGVALEIQTDPNPATRLRFWLFNIPHRYIAYAWNFLVPMVPLLWAFWFVLLRGGTPKYDGWRGARGPLLATLIALILFGGTVALAVGGRPIDMANWPAYRRVLVVVAFAVLSAAAIWLWSRQSPSLCRPLLVATTVVNLGVGFVLHALQVSPLDRYVPGYVRDWVIDTGRQWAILVPVWAVGNVIFGSALMAVMLLPAGVFGRIPPTWRGALWWCGTILIVIVILAQWSWSAYYRELDPRFRATFTGQEWRELSRHIVFRRDLQAFPIDFLAPSIDLLPLLGLAAAIGALVAVAVSPGARFLTKGDDWVNRTLIFLFAAFVVGLAGYVLGYRIPLAFLFCLGLAGAILQQGVAQIVAGIADGEPAAVQRLYSSEARRELFRQAIPLDDPAAPGTEQDIPPVRLPPTVHPKKLALPLGPGDGWWASGALAVRWGAILALIPLGFYIYVLATTEIGAATSAFSVFGGATLIMALLREVAFWLVAAFVLGALFPYLRGGHGPAKALTLALLYGAARSLAALVFNAADGNPWMVRFFQLFLFLVVLGVCLDVLSLRASQIDWRHLRTLYNLENTRQLIGFLSPLIVAIGVVIENLLTGQAEAAVVKIIESLPTAIPNI